MYSSELYSKTDFAILTLLTHFLELLINPDNNLSAIDKIKTRDLR